MARDLEAETLGQLWRLLSPHGHACLLEVADLPSLNYCVTATTASTPFESRTVDGWVDVVVANRPKRDDTRVPVKVTSKRRAWWQARAKAGGSVYTLLRLRPVGAGRALYVLLPAGQAADDLDNVSVERMQSIALATWEDALPEGNGLARWLVS